MDQPPVPLDEVTTTSVQPLVASLSPEGRANLAYILRIEEDDATSISERIRWLYHSKVRKEIRSKAHAAANFALSKTGGKRIDPITEEDYPPPSWAKLIEGLARTLKVYDASAELLENQCYICDEIVVRALRRMPAKARRQFFEAGLDVGDVAQDAPQKGRLKGPLRMASALGAANALGFGLYTSATTALGFVTHAVGITLPFVAYAGLSSTIAFAIGPPGWLFAGFYAFWKLTSADWKALTPAIIFLIQATEATRLERFLPGPNA